MLNGGWGGPDRQCGGQKGTRPWALNKAAVDAWIRTARTGDEIVYARGLSPLPTDGVKELQRLADQRAVTFTRQRKGPEDFAFIVQRLAGEAGPAKPPPAAGDETADQKAALMIILRRIVSKGQACPPNRELGRLLAEELDLAQPISPDRISYLLGLLRSAGRIAVEAGLSDARIVTLLATGQRSGRGGPA
jgi:hypothetical protein